RRSRVGEERLSIARSGHGRSRRAASSRSRAGQGHDRDTSWRGAERGREERKREERERARRLVTAPLVTWPTLARSTRDTSKPKRSSRSRLWIRSGDGSRRPYLRGMVAHD